jgi:hypothetical protein
MQLSLDHHKINRFIFGEIKGKAIGINPAQAGA